eukprot:CCRYP_011977-RC/>CCRYP_011977-RC protein AED:0.50 eAED:1.00 QI:0/-1/0/1/-1/0/1/0/10
MVRYTSSVAS